jgi:hypothetical protein
MSALGGKADITRARKEYENCAATIVIVFVITASFGPSFAGAIKFKGLVPQAESADRLHTFHALSRRNFHDCYLGVRMVLPVKVDVIAAGALRSKRNCRL